MSILSERLTKHRQAQKRLSRPSPAFSITDRLIEKVDPNGEVIRYTYDVFEGTADTPPSLHKYLYAYMNPTIFVDPDGNCPIALTMQECSDMTANLIGVDPYTLEGAKAVSEFETNQLIGAGEAVGETIAAPFMLAAQFGGSAVYQVSGGKYGAQMHEALGQTIAGGAQFISHPIETTKQGIQRSMEEQAMLLAAGRYAEAGRASGRFGTNASLTLAGVLTGGTGIVNQLAKRAPKIIVESAGAPGTLVDEFAFGADSAGAARVKGSFVKKEIKALPELIPPRGFKDAKQFKQAASELQEILKTHGINDASLRVRGSSTTGFSKNPDKPGKFFGDDDKTDIDLAIESEELTSRIRLSGKVTSNNIPGLFSPRKIKSGDKALFNDLRKWENRWQEQTGFDVSVGGSDPGLVNPDITDIVLPLK